MPKLTRRSLMAGLAGTTAPFGAASVSKRSDAGPLNLIHIGVDTWGTHWLGCYGNQQVRTPHVDALAAKSALFTQAYPEVLPTIPMRRSVMTGRRIFPSDRIEQPDDTVKIRGWHQLYAEDVTISEALRPAGYYTGFVSDVYHQFKPGKNFHRGFDSWRYIRGQEGDRLEPGPRKAINLADYLHPSQAAVLKSGGGPLQYLLNRRHWKTEEDWLAAQVFNEAARWLQNSAGENQPFYLHIESFSPHEFWDPPEDYYRIYMQQDYRGPRLISPPSTTAQMSPLEVEHARALYAGHVTFVDSRIGKFLQTLEKLGLFANTIIVFTADHGTMMGEQNQLHKGETRIREQVTHVPLLICHPRRPWAGRRVRGFVQHTDLMPTLLELLGVKAPARVTGESLAPLIESGRDSTRDLIVTGWGEHAALRTHQWCYLGRWSQGPPFSELYDVQRDSRELTNLAAQHPALVADLGARLKEYVDSGWSITRGTFARQVP